VDHIIPNDPANLQVLCSGCHGKKTNREMKALALRRKPDRILNDQPAIFRECLPAGLLEASAVSYLYFPLI
jgi:5-methylcytosine-specific restriction endonuclease McrA